jgi:hypothetical protein
LIELFLAFFFLIAAAGNGSFILSRLGFVFPFWIEELSFSLAVGLAVLMLLVLALGLAHLLYLYAVVLLIVIWGGIGFKQVLLMMFRLKAWAMKSLKISHFKSLYFWLVLLFILGTGLNLLRAMAPPHGATDPLAYQLALPKIFLEKHFFSFEPTVTGTLYPSNINLLFLVGIALRNGILAQIFHWALGMLSLLAIVGFSQRFFTLRVGIWGATFFSFMPVVVIGSPLGYVDLGLCFFQFMAFWGLINWFEKPERKNLVLAAVLTGVAMGTKHQGIASLMVGGPFILTIWILVWRLGVWEGMKNAGVFLAIALIPVVPWYMRSYWVSGNPFWPLMSGFWGGEFSYGPITAKDGTSSLAGVVGIALPSLEWFRIYWDSMSPWNWTFSPQGWQKAIGVYFVALLPGVFLFARERKHYFLLGFCVVYLLILVKFLHMNPRYGLVLFAFAGILSGLVAEGLASSRTWTVSLLFRFGILATIFLNLVWGHFLSKSVAGVALGAESRDSFLQVSEPIYRVMKFANEKLPSTSRILFQGIVKGFYCDHPYIWDHPYQKVIEYARLKTPEELRAHLRTLGISHIIRMIRVPQGRLNLGYPQYFLDEFHEEFRKEYLQLVYRDEYFVLFQIKDGV